MKKEYDFFYYLNILNKWKKRIALMVFAAVAFSMILVFLQPRQYESKAMFIVTREQEKSQERSVRSMLEKRISSFDIVIGIFQSRRMAEDIIDRFNLVERYKIKSVDMAVEKVKNMMYTFRVSGSHVVLGLIVVSDDPKLSADIANFSISNLGKINREVGISPEKHFVKVIDRATPTTKPLYRNILRHTSTAGLLALLTGIFMAFVSNYIWEAYEKKQR